MGAQLAPQACCVGAQDAREAPVKPKNLPEMDIHAPRILLEVLDVSALVAELCRRSGS